MPTDETFALHAPSVTLRVPQPSDAGALFGLASDPQVTQWFSWGPYERVEQAEAYIERLPISASAARSSICCRCSRALARRHHGPLRVLLP